jgi:hypothetical protein
MKFITFRMRSHTERTRSLSRATQHISPARGRGPPPPPEHSLSSAHRQPAAHRPSLLGIDCSLYAVILRSLYNYVI